MSNIFSKKLEEDRFVIEDFIESERNKYENPYSPINKGLSAKTTIHSSNSSFNFDPK